MTTITEIAIGRAPGTDYFPLRHQLNEDEIDYLDPTFEGTDTIQTLIVGRDTTAVAAFA